MPKKSTQRLLQYPSVNPLDESDLVCVRFKIPNRPEYRQAIYAAISVFGKWGVWERGGTNGTQIAELFRRLIYETFEFTDCDDDSMNCASVLSCLNTTLGQELIYNSANNPGSSGFRQNQINNMTTNIYNQNAVPSNSANCNDSMFAMIRQTIGYLNRLVIDFLERVEASPASNFLEMTDVVSRVTGLDEFSADAITGFAAWLSDNLLDAYPQASTQALLDEISCDIFCLVKNGCELDVDTFYSYFSNEGASAFPNPADLLSVVRFIDRISGVVLGANDSGTVKFGMLMVLGLVKLADTLVGRVFSLGNGANKIYAVLRAFNNDTDADWNFLCTCGNITGFVVVGEVGSTTVVKVGDTYTISRGFLNAGGLSFLYVQSSIDGAAVSQVLLSYTALSWSGNFFAYDWADENGNYGTPMNTPADTVVYAGIYGVGTSINGLQIVITTTLPFQGVIQGS